MGSCPTPPSPPPASFNCMGVADVWTAPMPAPRVRPAREQATSAPLTTLWVGAAGARQVPSPVPVPRKGAAEQPPFPPAQPELVNRVPEGAALPEPRVEAADGCSQPELMDSVRGVLRSWSRRSVRGRDGVLCTSCLSSHL